MEKALADFLTRQRAAFKAEATALTAAADKDNAGVLTEEQDKRFKAIEADIGTIDAAITASQASAETPEQAAERVRAETAEIMSLCNLAGMPAKAGEFITAKKSPAEVSKALLELRAKAAGPELIPHGGPGSAPTEGANAWDKTIARVNGRVSA